MENYSKRFQILQNIIGDIMHNWAQKVICVILSIVLVQLYNASLQEKRYLSCHVEYKYPDTLISSTTVPRTVRVSLWGNTSVINSVRDEDIIARVDASQIKLEGEYRLPIQFVKNNLILNGQSIEFHAEPSEIRIRLEEKMTKTVDIKLAIDGSPAEDYGITGTTIEPRRVNIEGPISKVEKIEGLNTEVVQVDNLVDDIDGVATITNNDPLIAIIGQPNVKYKIEIKEKEIKRVEDNIDIHVKNIDPNLEIVGVIPRGLVNIKGTKKALNTFVRPQEFLYIDLKNISGAGEYTTIPVQCAKINKMKNTQSIQVESYEPKNIRLVLKSKKIPAEE